MCAQQFRVGAGQQLGRFIQRNQRLFGVTLLQQPEAVGIQALGAGASVIVRDGWLRVHKRGEHADESDGHAKVHGWSA
jgi:hypothetical protein